jgi:hypothetical protein
VAVRLLLDPTHLHGRDRRACGGVTAPQAALRRRTGRFPLSQVVAEVAVARLLVVLDVVDVVDAIPTAVLDEPTPTARTENAVAPIGELNEPQTPGRPATETSTSVRRVFHTSTIRT